MRSRWGRTFAAAIVPALLLCLTACQPHEQTAVAVAPASPPASRACAGGPTRETCSTVDVEGRAQRYQLTRRGTRQQTVVVDYGGPGLSILSGAFNLNAFGSDQPKLSNYNLLFLEEPWVTMPLSDTCDKAMTAFYHALRNDTSRSASSAAGLTNACFSSASWGFDAETYTKALRQIALKEHLTLTGFLGYSFGDVRFAYAQSLGFQWATFVRPYPLNVSGSDIVAARAQAVTALLTTARSLPPRPDATSGPRSLPVTRFDTLSAQVALSYLDESSFSEYGREVVDGSNQTRIGSLSDDLWRRYGTEQVSPAYLAYLSEVCRTTSGWPTIQAIGTPTDVIAASTLPCVGEPAAAPLTIDARATSVCVVTSETDPVLPARVFDSMLAAHPSWRHVRTAAADHQSHDGIAACLG